MRRSVVVKDLQKGDILLRNGQAIFVKYVDINPKTVYIKGLNGVQLSFPATQKVEVV